MTPDDRYDVSDLPEAQFEPGSNEQVLKNRLGIVSTQNMDDTETRALEEVMDTLIRRYDQAHRFTASDICEGHRTWLGDIYEWAGHYRQINVSKDDFPFAAARHIPALMEQFEQGILRRFRRGWIRITDRWKVSSRSSSSGAFRPLDPSECFSFSEGTRDGFDRDARFDRCRAGNVDDERLPVFRGGLQVWIRLNERFHDRELYTRNCC